MLEDALARCTSIIQKTPVSLRRSLLGELQVQAEVWQAKRCLLFPGKLCCPYLTDSYIPKTVLGLPLPERVAMVVGILSTKNVMGMVGYGVPPQVPA